jgi:hypothetical protein
VSGAVSGEPILSGRCAPINCKNDRRFERNTGSFGKCFRANGGSGHAIVGAGSRKESRHSHCAKAPRDESRGVASHGLAAGEPFLHPRIGLGEHLAYTFQHSALPSCSRSRPAIRRSDLVARFPASGRKWQPIVSQNISRAGPGCCEGVQESIRAVLASRELGFALCVTCADVQKANVTFLPPGRRYLQGGTCKAFAFRLGRYGRDLQRCVRQVIAQFAAVSGCGISRSNCVTYRSFPMPFPRSSTWSPHALVAFSSRFAILFGDLHE